MATENIMMDAVKRGGNRQELHEKIREYSMIAATPDSITTERTPTSFKEYARLPFNTELLG